MAQHFSKAPQKNPAAVPFSFKPGLHFQAMLNSVASATGSHIHSQRPLIVAAASARALAQSAAAAGFKVLATDCFQDQDLVEFLRATGGQYLGQMTSFNDLPHIIEQLPHSIPLLWAGGLENQLDLLRQISLLRPLAGLPLTAVLNLRSPQALATALGNHGPLACPESVRGRIPATGRWLWKSAESSGGLGIQRITPELLIQLSDPHRCPHGYFQQELQGLPVSAIACSDGQHTRIAGMTLQWSGWQELGAEPFRYCGNLGPLTSPPRLFDAVQNAATALFRHSGNPHGILGMDMLLTPEKCWLLEVNPRIPASSWIHEAATPWNAVAWLLCDNPATQHPATNPPAADSLFPQTLRTQLIIWSRKGFHSPDLHDFAVQMPAGVRIADRPAQSAWIPPNSPLCSLLCEAEDTKQLSANLRSLPAGLMSLAELSAWKIADSIEHHWRSWLEIAQAWG